MCFLFFLFSLQVQREVRQDNRINGGKENRRDKFGQRHRGEDKQNQREKKSPMWQGSPHSNVAMCVTNSETLKSSNSHNRQNFAKSMIWQSSCILHTISMRSSTHLVQRADCHFPLEIHMWHWPYVLCQTETLPPTFSEMGLRPFCWFCSVCVHNVSRYGTTGRQGFCHHWLLPPSGPAIITSASARLVSRLTPGSWLVSLEFTLLGKFSHTS